MQESIEFDGFNKFLLENIDFYPLYSIQDNAIIKPFILYFNENSFQNKIEFIKVNFYSGNENGHLENNF